MRQQGIKRAEVLSPSQIRHLLRVTDATSRYPERDAVILLLGLGCGMRITETAQVTVADFLFSKRRAAPRNIFARRDHKGVSATLCRSVVAEAYRCVTPVCGHRRERGIGTTLGRTDFNGLNCQLPLIVSRKGYPYLLSLKRRENAEGCTTDYWAADSLQAYVTGLYRAAGLRGTSHSGRRTFATSLFRKGATIEQVQLLLGHESIDDTSRYIDNRTQDFRAAIAAVI
ncbi:MULTISPECIES: tyrosine-type recombinase/integrase [Burkholderiaceae]|uniref:tyrosine-type recombinase/integrase n=1 Tax=Burkholderiaceae TaxID=119060 RepID=UPI0009E9BBD0|nr:MULTISPECIES: site-specific integrase [Burkholderiaceae]